LLASTKAAIAPCGGRHGGLPIAGLTAPSITSLFYYVFRNWGHLEAKNRLALGDAWLRQRHHGSPSFILHRRCARRREVTFTVRIVALTLNALYVSECPGLLHDHSSKTTLVYFALCLSSFQPSGDVPLDVNQQLLRLGGHYTGYAQVLLKHFPNVFSWHRTLWSFAHGVALLRKAIIRQTVDARLLAVKLDRQSPALAGPNADGSYPIQACPSSGNRLLVRNNAPFGWVFFDPMFKASLMCMAISSAHSCCARVSERAAINIRGRFTLDASAVMIHRLLPGIYNEEKLRYFGNASTINAVSLPTTLSAPGSDRRRLPGFFHFQAWSSSRARLYGKGDFALYKADSHRRSCVLV